MGYAPGNGSDAFGFNPAPDRGTAGMMPYGNRAPMGGDWMFMQPSFGAPDSGIGSTQGFESPAQESYNTIIIVFVPAGNSAFGFVPNAANTVPSMLTGQLNQAQLPDLSHTLAHLGAPPSLDLADMMSELNAAGRAGTASVSTIQSATSAVHRTATPTVATSTILATGDLRVQPDHELVAEAFAPSPARIAGTTSVASLPVASNADHASTKGGAAVAKTSGHAAVEIAPENLSSEKTALAGISLNLKSVQKAVDSVMSQIHKLEGDLGQWIDENPIACVTVAVAAATLGGATAYYLRRRAAQEAEQRDEETSSNWLFVRMQTTVGDP
jgi:hypothetical protein